jgi:predicted MFS family arabinose efflux permease
LGQILIGIVWGSPLAEWLHVEWQETFVVVGYVGLLLVVFEGESLRGGLNFVRKGQS